MSRSKTVYSIALLLAFASSARAEVKNPDTYTYATIGDGDSMDPAWAYDTASHMIILNVYEPLFFYDKESTERLVPLIAEKVPNRANGLLSADGRTYRIPIRKGIRFQDGTPLTPEDARYSLLRFLLIDRDGGPSTLLLEPLLGYPSTRDDQGKPKPGAYADAAKAVQVEGDAVVLRLPQAFAPLPSILANWSPIVSKAWAVKNGDWDGTEASWTRHNNPKKESTAFFERAMGSGPFKLDRWDRTTQTFVLTRHARYWRNPAGLARVVVKGVKEFGTRKLMLEAGDADAISAERQSYSQLQGIPGVRIVDDLPTVEMNPVVFFTFKVNPVANPYVGSGRLDGSGVPPDFFNDKDVRKAFAYSVDYDAIIREVYAGKGSRATGCIPRSLPGHNPKQEVRAFDLAKAAEHFKRAHGGRLWEQGFQFTLTWNSGNDTRQKICQILKRNVESINPKFRLDMRPVEWPTFLDGYKAGRFPIFVMGWNADYPDAHNFTFPLLHSKGSFPEAQKYASAEADRLIDQARGMTDPAARKAVYAELQAIEFEDAPHLLILDTVRFRTERDWVRGWYPNPIFPDSPYGSYFYPITKSLYPGTLNDKLRMNIKPRGSKPAPPRR